MARTESRFKEGRRQAPQAVTGLSSPLPSESPCVPSTVLSGDSRMGQRANHRLGDGPRGRWARAPEEAWPGSTKGLERSWGQAGGAPGPQSSGSSAGPPALSQQAPRGGEPHGPGR